MLRGLFEGTQYNSEAGAKCAVYSRARSITLRPGQSARSIRGRELNKCAVYSRARTKQVRGLFEGAN